MITKSIYPRIMKKLFQSNTSTISGLATDLNITYKDLKPALKDLDHCGYIRFNRLSGSREYESSVTLCVKENAIIGLDLGGTKLFGAIVGFNGEILYEVEVQDHMKAGEACFDFVVSMLVTLLERAKPLGVNIRGIGIQVPGRVRLEDGVVLNAPAVRWKEYPLKEKLKKYFDLPILIDNDLKQSALGEAWFGAGKHYNQIALIAIGTGIAASVVANDELQRGAHLRHGEIGWMVTSREFLGKTFSGFGPFEVENSGPGIARRARLLLSGKRSESELLKLTGEDVFNAARVGEEWAEQVVSETIDNLAILLANTMAFYDPDIIIFSGGVSRSSDLLIEPALELIQGCVLTTPTVVVSSLGYRAGVLGAAVNLFMNCPDFYSVKMN